MSSFDGSERRRLYSDTKMRIFGVFVIGDKLYWSDLSIPRRSVWTANKHNLNISRRLFESHYTIFAIEAYHSSLQPSGKKYFYESSVLVYLKMK